MKISKKQLLNYLVDVKGYNELDAEQISWEELEETDKEVCIEFSK